MEMCEILYYSDERVTIVILFELKYCEYCENIVNIVKILFELKYCENCENEYCENII